MIMLNIVNEWQVTITWHLVASDGGGNVQAKFDPNGMNYFIIFLL